MLDIEFSGIVGVTELVEVGLSWSLKHRFPKFSIEDCWILNWTGSITGSTFPVYFGVRIHECGEIVISVGTGLGCTGVVAAGIPKVEYVVVPASKEVSLRNNCGSVSTSGNSSLTRSCSSGIAVFF